MPHFKVNDGESFKDHTGKLTTGGGVIELDAESAKLHAHRVVEVPAVDARSVVDVVTADAA